MPDDVQQPCGIDDHDMEPIYAPKDEVRVEPIARRCRRCGLYVEIWD